MLERWARWRAYRRWVRGADLRFDFAFFAIGNVLAVGDPEYYRRDCTIDEFEDLVNVVEASSRARKDKVAEARRMIP